MPGEDYRNQYYDAVKVARFVETSALPALKQARVSS